MSTDQSGCQAYTNLYLHCRATGGFIVLKTTELVIRIFVTFYFRSWSEYKHWMEFWRRIWIGNSTNLYSGAGWYVCCVPRRNEFEIQICTDALLYQIFLLFTLSHRCSAPGIYAWLVHPNFQHDWISLLWKVTNDVKSNMYITLLLFESQTAGLPAVTLPSFELSLTVMHWRSRTLNLADKSPHAHWHLSSLKWSCKEVPG